LRPMLRFVARGLIARQNDFLVLRPRANAKVMHSEDDQIVPYVAAGPLSAKLLKNGTLKTYHELWESLKTRACVVHPIETTEYGVREFGLLDDIDYQLSFAEYVAPN
jgi:hypothetical protein